MGQVHHGSATTTAAVRRAIQHSQESLRDLAKRHGINPKTVAKSKARTSVEDQRTGPKDPKSTAQTIEEEAIIVAFRRHTLLPLDDCLYALRPYYPASDAIVAAPLVRLVEALDLQDDLLDQVETTSRLATLEFDGQGLGGHLEHAIDRRSGVVPRHIEAFRAGRRARNLAVAARVIAAA